MMERGAGCLVNMHSANSADCNSKHHSGWKQKGGKQNVPFHWCWVQILSTLRACVCVHCPDHATYRRPGAARITIGALLTLLIVCTDRVLIYRYFPCTCKKKQHRASKQAPTHTIHTNVHTHKHAHSSSMSEFSMNTTRPAGDKITWKLVNKFLEQASKSSGFNFVKV